MYEHVRFARCRAAAMVVDEHVSGDTEDPRPLALSGIVASGCLNHAQKDLLSQVVRDR
jgi:hypothetical protein